MDDLTDEQTKRYIHHYNFPPYSVGEARTAAAPAAARSATAHWQSACSGARAALSGRVPHTIRCVSEVLSSNGSTSQASICGSTLA